MERNKGIDLLRLLCSFMVVYAHNSIDSSWNPYLIIICKVSVPVFFLITGYYHQSVIDRGKEKKELQKVAGMIVFSFLFYFLFFFLLYFRSGSFVSFLQQKFETESLTDIFLFNVNPLLHRLWYLNALFYVLIIAYVCSRKQKTDLLCLVSAILLIVGLAIGPYSRLLLKTDFSEQYTRNFIFVGLPYFCLGLLIRRYQEKSKNIRPLLFLLFSLILMVLEVCVLIRSGLYNSPFYVLTTPFVAVSLFLTFLKLSIQKKAVCFLSELGRRYSSDIYIFHKMIEVLLAKMIPVFSGFVFVFIGSLLFSVLYRLGRSIFSGLFRHI